MIKVGRVEGLKRRMRMKGCFVMEPVGKKGGLALLWVSDLDLEILNYSQ